jgi:hypothetical protein
MSNQKTHDGIVECKPLIRNALVRLMIASGPPIAILSVSLDIYVSTAKTEGNEL